MQEMWVTCLSQEDPLEKEMATRSSILAWEIHAPRILVGYNPWCFKRVRHNLVSEQQQMLVSGIQQ